jgi:DNA invertase Pin-like site-specific DNA recombinase
VLQQQAFDPPRGTGGGTMLSSAAHSFRPPGIGEKMTTAIARIPAAQYLRVSTEHQQYSLDNQSDFITRYAAGHGFSIVQTYTDRAKSGLLLKNRPGLKQLLRDVMERKPAYQAVLVYDVSRWGRFQDVDEAGHYEFLCKHSGVPVHYCAETFANDGTPASLIMKALKRTMAGEYSRELGLKCFAGQKRIAELGFRVGGAAGYGLRRILVSPDGQAKQPLHKGERKNLATDRVILVPGPVNEVAWVRQIYQMLIAEGMTLVGIAAELNRQAVPCSGSTCWTHHRVRAILVNPKYNGTVVYGRVSKKLGTKEIKVPASAWVRVPHAFEAIVDDATFAAAQQALANRTIHKSDDRLLDELRTILRTEGRLTAKLIRGTKGATPPASYRHRFGSLSRAYELAGYTMPGARNVGTRRRIQQARLRLMQELQRLFPEKVWIEGSKGRHRTWLRVKSSAKVAFRTCLCFKTALGQLRWRVKSDQAEDRLITVLLLMNPENDGWRELYLIPPLTLPSTVDISINSRLLSTGKRIPTPGAFLKVLAATSQRPRDALRQNKLTGSFLRASV